MKKSLLILAVIMLGACSMRETATMDNPTTQAFDLNDPDGDGVVDARERCASTINGAAIDNYGCGQVKTVNERRELNLLFPDNSDYLAPQFYPQIEELANFMRQFPNTTVTIEGHSSKTGTYERNIELSQRRASVVTQLLEKQFGIEASRLKAIGYGYERLLDSSDTPEAHDKNRRVIAEIVGDNTTTDLKWNIYSVEQPAQP